MLSRTSALVVFGLLLTGLATIDVSCGLTQAVEVIVLLDSNSASYGDRIRVTAQVFDAGSLADPSSISALVDRLPGVAPLTLARQSIGIFTGSFVFESHPSVVRVSATVGGASDSGGATVFHAFSHVRVVPSKAIAAPGDRISVALEMRNQNGSLQDADRLELSVTVGESPGFGPRSPPANLSWSRVAEGTYSARYTVPSGLVRNSIIAFDAAATIGTSASGGGANVYVSFPAPFIVWYRTVEIGATNATLEVDVASSAGVPLPNATVSLVTWPPGVGSAVSQEGVTDPTGAVRFFLDFPPTPANSFFYGNVTQGSDRQGFQGSLGSPTPPPVGPQLLRENPDEVFEAGQSAILRFRLVRDGVPIAGQELFAYAHSISQVLLAARFSTDDEGRVEIRFVVPAGFVLLDVSGYIGGTWETFHPFFYSASRVESSASSTDGWNFRISGRFPNKLGPWLAHVGLSAVSDMLEGPWSSGGPFGPERIVGGIGGSLFSVDVSLPRFLPAGLPVRVSIWVHSFGDGYGESRLTVVSGMPVSGAPVKGPVDVGVLVVVSGFAIVFAVTASGWRLRRRSRGS